MDKILNYTSYFHDGSIIDIKHWGDNITILMESAEVDQDDLQDSFTLSLNSTIRGKLHIEGIKLIKENNNIKLDILEMKYDDGEIFHFKIKDKKIELQIIWNSSPPKPLIKDFSAIEIEAQKIWWENIPKGK